MSLISPSKLFRIPYLAQGWTRLADSNFQRLNALYLRINNIVDVNVSGLQERDLLVWNSATNKWENRRYGAFFLTTTTTSSATTTTSTSTSTSTSSSSSSTSATIDPHIIQTRYWVGGAGSLNDPAHWAEVSGGPGGFSVPDKYDLVKFDANSFTVPGQKISVDGTFEAYTVDFTGVTNTPELELESGETFYCESNLKLIAGMTVDNQGTIVCRGTLTTAGHNMGQEVVVVNLADDLSAVNVTMPNDKAFTSNNHSISASGTLRINAGDGIVHHFGSSTVTAGNLSALADGANPDDWQQIPQAGFTIDFGTADITLTNSPPLVIFEAPHTNNNNCVLNATGTAWKLTMEAESVHTWYHINRVKFSNCELDSGTNVIFNPKYETYDGGGNTGTWTTVPNDPSGITYYWVGDSGDWDFAGHWALSSGGAPTASKPTEKDHVVFDANSFSAPGCTVSVHAGSCWDFTVAVGTPSFTMNHIAEDSYGVYVYGDYNANNVTYTMDATLRLCGIMDASMNKNSAAGMSNVSFKMICVGGIHRTNMYYDYRDPAMQNIVLNTYSCYEFASGQTINLVDLYVVTGLWTNTNTLNISNDISVQGLLVNSGSTVMNVAGAFVLLGVYSVPDTTVNIVGDDLWIRVEGVGKDVTTEPVSGEWWSIPEMNISPTNGKVGMTLYHTRIEVLHFILSQNTTVKFHEDGTGTHTNGVLWFDELIVDNDDIHSAIFQRGDLLLDYATWNCMLGTVRMYNTSIIDNHAQGGATFMAMNTDGSSVSGNSSGWMTHLPTSSSTSTTTSSTFTTTSSTFTTTSTVAW